MFITGRIGLLIFLGLAVVMDLSVQRIPNRFIIAGFFLAIGYRIVNGGIGSGITGMFLPFMLTGILFIFHMLGAGDIKLFMVAGLMLGPAGIFKCIIYSFLTGALLSLCKLLSNHNLLIRLHYLVTYFQNLLNTGNITQYYKKEHGKSCIISFSLPIFIGVCVYILEGCN